MNYPGGKGGCYHHIINLMPPHDIYIESHLGGGNVLERKLPAPSTIGIDIDGAVIKTWQEREEFNSPEYTFINDDARSTLQKMTFTGTELIYADPPYVMSSRKGGKLYRYEYTDEQHIDLLTFFKHVDCPVIISGYRSDLYMDMLSGWFYKTFSAATRRGRAIEYVWCNFKPSGKQSDYRYVGENFRERERIKRKRSRWYKNFLNMTPAERYSIYKLFTDHIVTLDDEAGNIVRNSEGDPIVKYSDKARYASPEMAIRSRAKKGGTK